MEFGKNNVVDKYRTMIQQNNKFEFLLQKEALERGKKLGHKFFVARDTKKGGKVCTSFVNVHYFINFFKKQTVRHYYEKIIDKRVEMYDIDGKIENHKYWMNDTKKIIDDFLECRKNWIETTDYRNKSVNPEKNIFILQSEKLNFKKSYHIIIRNGFIFKNNVEQKKFATEFSSYLKSKHNEDFALDIDTAVYGRNQCFRTIGSSKIGSDRTLIRSGYNKLSQKCDESLFFASYVDPEIEKVENLSIFDIDKNLFAVPEKEIEEDNPIFVKEDIEVSDDKAKQLFDCLTPEKWSDYSTCLSLIFLAKKMSINDTDLHEYCKKGDNYDYKWVQNIIDGRGECNIGLGTLRFHLKDCISEDEIKKIFPKSKTYEEIKKIPKKRRTPEEQAFLEQIRGKVAKKRINPIFNLKNCNIIDIEYISQSEKWCRPIEFPPGYRSIGLHLKMGGGKTKSCIKYVSGRDKTDRIIVLSPRITFANCICAEYNKGLKEILGDDFVPFVCYTDIKNKRHLRRQNRLIISMESLHHLTECYDPDLLIIDECQANLTSHLSKTNGTELDNNIFCFETFLKSSNCKIIWADAFFGEKTCDFIRDIGVKTKIYSYKTEMKPKKAYRLKELDPKVRACIREVKDKGDRDVLKVKASSWYKLLIHKLDQGKKVYFCCTTRKIVEYIEKDFQKRYPNKNGLFYVGKSKGEKQDDFSDVNKSWGKQDLVMTTTTITVGINCDIKNYFDCKIMYFSSSANNLVADMIQASQRVRHTNDDELFYFIDEKFYTVKNKNEIDLSLSLKERWYKRSYAGFDDKAPTHLKNLAINVIYEQQVSKGFLSYLTKEFLQRCNYELLEFDEDLDEPEVVEEEDDEEEDEEDNSGDFEKILDKYLKIKDLTINQKRELEYQRNIRKLTKTEDTQLQKFYFQMLFDTKIDPEVKTRSKIVQGVFWYYLTNKYKVFNRLANCKLEKLLNEGKVSLEQKAENRFDKHSLSMLHSDDLMKLELCKEIIGELGFEHINDTATLVGTDAMTELFDNYKDRYTEISNTMDIRDERKDKTDVTFRNFVGLITQIFSSSPSSLCKFRVKSKKAFKQNGKTKWKNIYGLEFNEPLLMILLKKNPNIGMELNEIPNYFYDCLGTHEVVEEERKRLLR